MIARKNHNRKKVLLTFTKSAKNNRHLVHFCRKEMLHSCVLEIFNNLIFEFRKNMQNTIYCDYCIKWYNI